MNKPMLPPTRQEWKDCAFDLANWLRFVLPLHPHKDPQAALGRFDALVERDKQDSPPAPPQTFTEINTEAKP